MGRRFVSAEEAQRFLTLFDQGLSGREIAALTGWSEGVVKDYTAGRRPIPTNRYDHTKFAAAYSAPVWVRTDDAKHQALVLAGRPQGFPVAFLPSKYRVAA